MSGHTPGPWHATADAMVCAEGRRGQIELATVYFEAEYATTKLPGDANARLMAAAPELLEALKSLREAATDAYKAGRIPAEPFVAAGNVIAKAEGR